MAAEGMRFTQFYAGSTVCAPSRSVLMTGLHTGHTRVRGNAGNVNPLAQSLRPEDATVARLLKEAGYATALVGKWGLGDEGEAADVRNVLRRQMDRAPGGLDLLRHGVHVIDRDIAQPDRRHRCAEIGRAHV